MKKPHRWIAGNKPQKHVILLGAGASWSSGYPLANELTLLMCDPPTFRRKLREVFDADGDGGRGFDENSVITQYVYSNDAAALLRDSDFSTMDELSKHAVGGNHADRIHELKKLMRLMLALHDPDTTHFAESDYRRFIQKLFAGGTLRQDVSIIWYNYDAYFEHRLFRDFGTRLRIRSPAGGTSNETLKHAILSGFLNPRDLSWLDQTGFCHLKLHGTCAFPAARRVGKLTLPPPLHSADEFQAGYLFGRFSAFRRLSALVQPPFAEQDPPAILPWEIVNENETRLLTEDEFASAVGMNWQHKSLYPLFKGIWERARREVQAADKISLVGLSLGQYQEPGLRYLFNEKGGSIQFVIANPENERFQTNQGQIHPNSPAGRAIETLSERCGMKGRFVASFSEYAEFNAEDYEQVKAGGPYEPDVTCHNSFRDFIEAEM